MRSARREKVINKEEGGIACSDRSLTRVLWCGGRHCLQHLKGSTGDGTSRILSRLRHLLFARMDVLLLLLVVVVVVNIPWKEKYEKIKLVLLKSFNEGSFNISYHLAEPFVGTLDWSVGLFGHMKFLQRDALP